MKTECSVLSAQYVSKKFIRRAHPRIAQHFSAGFRCSSEKVPMGRKNRSVVPAGLLSILTFDPALKCWAIFRLHDFFHTLSRLSFSLRAIFSTEN
jgi:hypothetical protein